MLTSWHVNEKSREVCIKARSPPALLAFIRQVTKHTTVKWPIFYDVPGKSLQSSLFAPILENSQSEFHSVV